MSVRVRLWDSNQHLIDEYEVEDVLVTYGENEFYRRWNGHPVDIYLGNVLAGSLLGGLADE